MRLAALLILLALPAKAQDFDYFVLSLSWSPTWCAQEGAARGDPQCDADHGFVLHGLWPQYERGYPEWCRTTQRDPSRSDSAAMADVIAPGLVWYQWKKHGRCSGLSARSYYAAMRDAVGRVSLPDVFERLDDDIRLPASVVEDAFLEANPALQADGLTVTCKAGMVQEVRICLTKELDPRLCGADVRRDCTLTNAEMPGR